MTMAIPQDLLYNVTGQKVVYYPPQGRPSSVTSCEVFEQSADDDSTAEAAVGTPEVKTSPNTTVDATSAAGQRTLSVAATTGFVTTRSDRRDGQYYLVTGSQSEAEWFQVAEIASADSLILTAPLVHTYVSPNPVVTTRIQATIDSTWVADKQNISGNLFGVTARWRVRWKYVVGSGTYVADSYFDLVRYPGNHEITAKDIDNHVPGFIDLLPEHHASDQGQRLIDHAYHQMKVHFASAGKADQLVRNSEMMNHLLVLGTIEQWCYARYMQAGNSNLRQAWQDARDVYQSQLNQLVRVTTVVPMSTDQGGSASKVAATHLLRR